MHQLVIARHACRQQVQICMSQGLADEIASERPQPQNAHGQSFGHIGTWRYLEPQLLFPKQQEAVRPGRPTKLDPTRATYTDHIAGL